MVHPIVAAKMATTIDRISGGWFGLNLADGLGHPELAMFGEQRQQEDRYAFGQEDRLRAPASVYTSSSSTTARIVGVNLESTPSPYRPLARC